MKYGEEIIANFDVEKDLEIWPNKSELNYVIKITLPEFVCLCPRSGYPDFAQIFVEYIPNDWVVELKALKLYINSFMSRSISHEDSANEIYTTLFEKLKPKYLSITASFNPRGNVYTTIEINSNTAIKATPKEEPKEGFTERREYKSRSDRGGGDRRERKFSDRKSYDKKPYERKSYDRKSSDERSYDKKSDRKPYERKTDRKDGDKFDKRPAKKEPFFKSDKLKSQRPKVVKQ